MKALLLGPNGQLGQDILRANDARGALEIESFGRDKADLSEVDAALARIGEAEFDVLINCAAIHKTDEVEGAAQLAFTINAHLVQRLAALCARRNARFIHVSTDYVFGGQAKRAPLVETDAKAPLNVYGASKGMGEDLALSEHDDVLILRVASLFGVAGASGKGGNFIETMLRLGRERQRLSIVDDQIMSPTATADIAQAMVTLIASEAPAGLYHVVNDEGAISWCAFAREIFAQSTMDVTVEAISSAQYPTPAKRPPYSALDNAKLKAAGVAMPSWRASLRDYLRAKRHIT